MSVVPPASWTRRHPMLSALAALALLGGLIPAAAWGYSLVLAPALPCGPGMAAAGSPATCVGVNLDGSPFTAHDPARMRNLEAQVASIDRDVRGPYASIVLLLDLSPVDNGDTITYGALYPNIEGTITAVWRANNTAGRLAGTRDIKLYLGNMGSKYGSWHQAVAQVKANAAARHIASVIGLGQSTAQTESAAALLSSSAHLPVIGSTVTGDSMNTSPITGRQIPDFFRVSPPNSATVAGAAQYISGLRPRPATIVIVADNAQGDDYTSTLAQQAERLLPTPGRTVKTLTYTAPSSLPPGVTRQRVLNQQFNLLDGNLCQDAPSEVYFAGRGYDLPTFVSSWEGAACSSISRLNIISGDDASSSISYSAITDAIRSGAITLTYTALASPDMWGKSCPGSAAKANYDQFWAAFTGNPVPCTGQKLQQIDNARPLDFHSADLDSGQAILTNDAAVAAITAIHDDSGLVLADPKSQTAMMHQFACTQALPGAGGWVAFAPDGNPVGRPVPVVQVNGSGTVTTVDLTWPGSAQFLSPPTLSQAASRSC